MLMGRTAPGRYCRLGGVGFIGSFTELRNPTIVMRLSGRNNSLFNSLGDLLCVRGCFDKVPIAQAP